MTLDCRSIVENCLLRDRGTNMIDLCLSALATAWLITFVATTGFVAALAAEDATVHKLLFEVRHLLKPRSALRDPDLVERVKALEAQA